MTTDIIMQVPWNCGDRSCPQKWHMGAYWIDGDEYTYDEFMDGDHETIEEKDIPSTEEYDAAWHEYFEHVAATGEDPLGEFMGIKDHKDVQVSYEVDLVITGDDVVATRVRRPKKAWTSEIPKVVVSYLGLDKDRRLDRNFLSMEPKASAREVLDSIIHLAEGDKMVTSVVVAKDRWSAKITLRLTDKAPNPWATKQRMAFAKKTLKRLKKGR